MNDGIKITTRQETFNDRAIDELAEVKAACLCRLQYKRCLEDECAGCSHGRNYNETVKHMNTYDKSRLMQRTSEAYGRLSLYPESFMTYKRIRNRYAIVFIFFFLCLAAMVYLCNLLYADELSYKPTTTAPTYCYANTAPEGSEETADSTTGMPLRDIILDLREKTRLVLTDINGDGRINCVDNALIFKILWDQSFISCNCIIVRNYNPGVLNHLFVMVYLKKADEWYPVETTTVDNSDRIHMSDYWGSRYDPAYNRYDEQTFWMRKVVNKPNWDGLEE